MKLRRRRLQANSALMRLDSRCELILRLQRIAKIILRRRERWIKLKRRSKFFSRTVRVSLFEQNQSQLVVIHKRARIDRDGPRNQFDRPRITTLLMNQITQKLQRIGVI